MKYFAGGFYRAFGFIILCGYIHGVHTNAVVPGDVFFAAISAAIFFTIAKWQES